MYKDFLGLCGFEKEEIDKELPRIERAFQKLHLTSDDIKNGEERLKEYFDLELKGMQKIFGIYIRELTNLVLAGEEKEKILYNVMPTLSPDLIGAAMLMRPEAVYAGFPDFLVLMTLGAIFGKVDHIFEAAERHCGAPGAAHCGCCQTRLGMQLLGTVPKPDLILSWGHYCDEVPKMDELLNLLLGIHITYVNRCQDENWDEFPEPNQRTVDFYVNEMRKAVRDISQTVGLEISEDAINEGLMGTLQYFVALGKIKELLAVSDPVPMSFADLMYPTSLLLLGVSPENRAPRMEATNLLYEELKERVKEGKGVTEKGAPRIFHTGFPSFVDPSIIKMIYELGIQISLLEGDLYVPNCRFMPDFGDADDYDKLDPFVILTKAFLMSPVATVTSKRIDNLIEACKKFEVDGVLFYYHFSCRTYGTESQILRDALKKELNIPTMVLEGDIFDPRYYTQEQLRTRIEAFSEMVQVSRS